MSSFKSPNSLQFKPNPFQVLSFLLGRYKRGNIPPKVPSGFKYPNQEDPVDLSKPTVMWINHSTYLVELNGKVILTDPIWSKRCSPFPFFGPKRRAPPPISMNMLPSLFAVIISHNHYDHLDHQTIRKLSLTYPSTHWIVPWGLKKWFLRHFPHLKEGVVHELHWEDEVMIEGMKFTSVPAQHFSGRHLFDSNKTGWMGCLVRSEKSFYFVGDTGYNPFIFKEIGKKFSPIDLSLIPVGTYLPRDFLGFVHVDPGEAVKIHQEIGSRLSVGGHFGTFDLSYEPPEQPPYDLYQTLLKENIPWERFRILRPGQKINW